MTKEEYAKYLNSDYWRGFSYSIIKERNFTCEDCGSQFPNERNKLQVHHLVYRDVAPWSYKPEEMVVLCERCHKMRHGLPVDPIPSPIEEMTVVDDFVIDDTIADGWIKINEPFPEPPSEIDRWAPEPEPTNNHLKRWGLIAAMIVMAFVVLKSIPSTIEDTYEEETNDVELVGDYGNMDKPRTSRTTSLRKKQSVEDVAEDASATASAIADEAAVQIEEVANIAEDLVEDMEKGQVTMTHKKMERSTLEILEERQHKEWVERAKKASVSTEGSTTDIIERIQHKDWVERAKKAGVSTEGSTTDIIERIQHKDWVERAKKAGVSTEGSTTDIIERIQHKDWVERAKKAGVSTEGSTLDIMKRIQRKEFEKYQ